MTPTVDRLDVSAYTIPTEAPESDGTLEWHTTTAVVVEAHGDGRTGVGYTYCHTAAADLISGLLAAVVAGQDALRPGAAWAAMQVTVRNVGHSYTGYAGAWARPHGTWARHSLRSARGKWVAVFATLDTAGSGAWRPCHTAQQHRHLQRSPRSLPPA